jgi:general secretion pathway protein D
MTDVQPRAMKHLRFSAMTALAVLCMAGLLIAPAAFAQTGVPTVKPTPFPAGVGRPELPKLKSGITAKNTAKGGAKGAPAADGEDAPGDSLAARRLPPPGGPRAGAADPVPVAAGAGPGAESNVPKWQQSDGAASGPPTLSKDFINNCQKLKPNVKVHLDIYQEDLSSVVKMIACMTGKNIILGKEVTGKITIYSPTPVTAQEAYRAFLSALEANGKTISDSGKFLKIIEIKDYVHGPDPLRPQGTTPPNEDRMVTQIVPLKHVDAQDMNEVLTKLASGNATFIVYAPSNSLIITEVASNLRKLLDLLKELDVPGGQEQLFVYQVLHAEAGDISQKILEIFEQKEGGKKRPGGAPAVAGGATGGGKGKSAAGGAAASSSVGDSDQDVRVGKVIADERTNRLLIVATARSYRQIKDLIAKLDVAIEGDGQVHIHQLNNAKAEDLANTLSSLSQDAKARQGNKGKGANAAAKAGAAAGGAVGGAGGAGSAALFEGEVKISADESTNALVITSSFKDYLSLKKVIEILDRPRRQVFLEAVVMEVSLTNNRQFGLAFHGPLYDGTIGGKEVVAIGKSQPAGKGLNSLDMSNAATLQGMAIGASTTDTIPLLGGQVNIPSFGAIMQALATSSDANILSTPNILTTDNEEAEIVVGSNVPFISQSGGLGGLSSLAAASAISGNNSNAAGLGSLLGGLGVQVQRQDVALTLKITPRISNSNFVTLEVDQVVEEIESNDPTLGPTTSKRSVKTTVVVKDQQTIVIGGLQKNVQSQSVNKVPFLGEIPIIGYLFRDTATRGERRNLILMLTPHVIESQDDFKAIFKRKMEEHREFVARFHKEGDAYVVGVDYAKKHGALEAIHKAVRTANEEQRLIEEVKKQTQGPALPQDVDGVPLSEGPIVVPGGGGASGDPGDAPPPSDLEPVDVPPPPSFEPSNDAEGGGEP